MNGKVSAAGPDGFRIQITQSFGNCRKYVQTRRPTPGAGIANMGEKRPLHRGEALSREQAALIARADTLFIASQFSEDAADRSHGIDVSHCGGKPGFALVAHETLLLVPDYAGNNLFNTLGNIAANPKCGLLFIDFDSGDTLQLTGEAAILWEPTHTRRFAGAKRVLAFTVEEVLQIERALPFSWEFQGYSTAFDRFEAAETRGDAGAHLPSMRIISVNVWILPRSMASTPTTVAARASARPACARWSRARSNTSRIRWTSRTRAAC